jgi:NMD protein affecting ribosome stability and mRNA decay
MKRSIIQKSSIKLPRSNKDQKNEGFGRQDKGVTECAECKNVHYMKRWHASLAELQKHSKNKRLQISKTEMCPACKMIKENLFEGEVLIDKFPQRLHEELFNLAYNFAERSKQRDPQNRIIALEKGIKVFRITTTENQLARKLGKKIRDVFSTVNLKFTDSREPYAVSRVLVTYEE